MVMYCVVPGCKNSALIPGMRFHVFPKCPRLKRLWEIKIRRDSRLNKPISSTMRVCSEHFTESDYRESHKRDKKFLKKDAFPSVFSFNTPPESKPKRILRPVTNASIPQENASAATQGESDSNLVNDEQHSNAECLEVSRTVCQENVSVEIQENIDSYLINENIEEYLDVRIPEKTYMKSTMPKNQNVGKSVAHVAEELSSLQNNHGSQNTCMNITMPEMPEAITMPDCARKRTLLRPILPKSVTPIVEQLSSLQNNHVSQNIRSVEIQEGNNLTGEQFNKNVEVCMAVLRENRLLGLNNKLLQEKVKKLEDELAAVKSENGTLRCLVSELTTELLKYKQKQGVYIALS